MERKFEILVLGFAQVSLIIFIFGLLLTSEKNFENFIALFPKEWLNPYIGPNVPASVLFYSLMTTFFLVIILLVYFEEKHTEKDESMYKLLFFLSLLWIGFSEGLEYIFNLEGILNYMIILIPISLGAISIKILYSKKKENVKS